MRKILFMVVMFTMLSIVLSGCVASNRQGEQLGRDSYSNLINLEGNIWYGNNTEICYYIISPYTNGQMISPFYGKDKQLVTKDEYIKNYMQK